jgi:phospholipid/cholesterol/gamma-HCH transport system permease protein
MSDPVDPPQHLPASPTGDTGPIPIVSDSDENAAPPRPRPRPVPGIADEPEAAPPAPATSFFPAPTPVYGAEPPLDRWSQPSEPVWLPPAPQPYLPAASFEPIVEPEPLIPFEPYAPVAATQAIPVPAAFEPDYRDVVVADGGGTQTAVLTAPRGTLEEGYTNLVYVPRPPKQPTTSDRIASMIPKTLRNTLDAIGGLYTMAAASIYGLFDDIVRRKFEFQEFIDRCWFLVNVTVLPAILVSVPLGVAIALQVSALAAQVGATSFVGAANALGILREAAPIITALLLAGVGGSSVCAELGSRTIREEIDAMIVLGLNPLRRLVAPLILAGIVTSAFITFVVIFVAVGSGYFFDLAVLHGTKGSFFGSFTQFATMTDFVTSEIKACTFGLSAILIAAYKGLNAKRGPTGVGEAVNQSVVITGIVLFGFNLIITEIFFALVPQRTF